MKRDYPPFYVIASCIGFLCIAVDLASNVEFMHEQTKTLFDSSVAAVVVVGIGGTIALSASMAAFRNMAPITGVMLLFGYLAAVAFSLSATLDRVATQRDTKLERIWSTDAEIQRLIKVRDRMEYTATREATEGKRDRRGRLVSPPGKGDAYNAAMAEAQIAKDLIAKRKAELDSLGKRISAMTGGRVTPQQASEYQPCILPVALLLLGQWLVAFGLNGRKVKAEFDLSLTGRAADQDKVLRFTRQFQATHQRQPTAAEVHRALGITSTKARRHLRSVA